MAPEFAWFCAGMAVALVVAVAAIVALVRIETRALTRSRAAEELEALMNRQLPVDVTAGDASFRAGVRVSTLLQSLRLIGRW